MRAQAICLALTIVLFSSYASAQWVQTNGPFTAPVRCLTVNGTTILVLGGSHELYLSPDNGTNWTEVSPGVSNTYLTSLAVSGTNLVAGSRDEGILLSTNYGSSWTVVKEGLPKNIWDTTRYDMIESFASNGQNLFAGTQTSGVVISTNSGRSWTYAGLKNTGVFSLAASGTSLFAGTEGGVFLSTNNGANWTLVGLPNGVQALAVSGTNLLAGAQAGVFFSTNSGASWTLVNPSYAYSLLLDGMNFFAVIQDSILLSTDSGASWTPVSAGLTSTSVQCLAVCGTELFAGTEGGLFHSANLGSSWTRLSQVGARDVYISTLFVRGSEVFVGSDWGLNGGGFSMICHSLNNGDSWASQKVGQPRSIVVQGSDVFVGTTDDGVLRSTDSGATWTDANSGMRDLYGNSPMVYSLAVSGGNIFAGAFGVGVFRSTDKGTSWEVTGELPSRWVTSLAVSGSMLFVGTEDRGVFLSTNNGTIWTSANTPFGTFCDMVQIDSNLFAGTNEGVYLSTTYGANWTAMNNGLTSKTVISIAASGTNLIAGTLGGRSGANDIFLSTNCGISWQAMSPGLNLPVTAISVTDAYVFVGTGYILAGFDGPSYVYGSGVWRRPISEIVTSVERPSGNTLHAFSLNQNYPNPFNPSTTIRYSLPNRAHVTLTVFNTLGQKVAELVSGDIDAGYHSIQFNASRLASGVYLYRLQAGEFVQAKKFVILK